MIENITNFTFNHSDQADDLYKVMTATEVKQAFDSRGNELKDKVNEVITQSNTNETEISKRTLSTDFETHKTSGDHDARYSLKSSTYTKTEIDNNFATKTENNSKADKTTTYTKTETNNLVAGVTLGQIPNNSLTEQKMANDMKKDIVGGVTSYNEYKTFKDNTTSSLSDIAVSVKNFGAKGDGVTDDTQAFLNALQNNISIYVPKGTYIVNELILPARNCFIYSSEGTIKGTSGTFVFKQRKRGYLTKIEGVIFLGNSTAFHYDSDDSTLPNGGQYYEYMISKCRFLQVGAINAINLYGIREGVIDNCYFENNNGILTEFSINSVVSNCQFKNNNYMVRSKLGSEGLIVSNAVALGCSYGILCERTTGVQIINSMIDYCDIPILLKGATDVLISNNYISTRTVNPAIKAIKYDDGFRGYNHKIGGNLIKDNYSSTGSACIRYEETDFINIIDNILSNYASYGIVYTSCTQANIARNIIRNRSGLGTYSIYALTDDTTVSITNNVLVQTLARTYNNSTSGNAGFKTQGKGEAVLPSGSSTVTVTHGLAATPLKSGIKVTPTSVVKYSGGNAQWYIGNVTATTFDIICDNVLNTQATFSWSAQL